MRIESRGVDIVDVPGVTRITVERDSIVIDMESKVGRYDIGQVAQIRNALNAALAEHAKLDTAMTTPNTEPAFYVGQVLDGTEDLPIGTLVQDSDKNGPDTWTYRGDLWETADGDTVSVKQWPKTVRLYGPITIVSLP